MTKNLLKISIVIFPLLCLLGGFKGALGCQLFAATGDVTKDSISILAKEREIYWRKEQRIWHSPRSTHSTGDSIHFRNISTPQCSLTYKFLATNSIVMDQTTGYGINEYGLAIISHDMDSWDDDSLGAEFFHDQDYVALALARCKSSSEAIDFFEDLVLPHGINAETYLIADPTSLWLMETTGFNFVAKPIFDDVASSKYQQYNIRTEWSDPGNRHNADLLANAQTHGCGTNPLDFAVCFGNRPPAVTDPDLLALRERGNITAEDMKKLVRDKAHSGTVSACVIPVRPDKDPAYFAFMWDSRADPEYGNVFLPFWVAVSEDALPQRYTSWPLDDPDCAWNKFNKITKVSTLRDAAQPVWQALQAELDGEFDTVEAAMQTCLDSNDLAGLQAYIDRYVFGELDSAYKKALKVIENAGVPVAVSDITAILAGQDLMLDWSAVTVDKLGNLVTVDHYYVYREVEPSPKPGIQPFDTTAVDFYVDESGVIGDPYNQYRYWVTAIAGGKQSGASGKVGEFDRQLSAVK
jgi:dipeptidase